MGSAGTPWGRRSQWPWPLRHDRRPGLRQQAFRSLRRAVGIKGPGWGVSSEDPSSCGRRGPHRPRVSQEMISPVSPSRGTTPIRQGPPQHLPEAPPSAFTQRCGLPGPHSGSHRGVAGSPSTRPALGSEEKQEEGQEIGG